MEAQKDQGPEPENTGDKGLLAQVTGPDGQDFGWQRRLSCRLVVPLQLLGAGSLDETDCEIRCHQRGQIENSRQHQGDTGDDQRRPQPRLSILASTGEDSLPGQGCRKDDRGGGQDEELLGKSDRRERRHLDQDCGVEGVVAAQGEEGAQEA